MNVVNAMEMANEPATGLYIIRAINDSNASAAILATLAHYAEIQANKIYRIKGSEPAVNTTTRQAPGLCFRSAANGHHHDRVSAVISRRLAQEPLPPLTCRAGESDYGVWPVTDSDTVLALESGIKDIPILYQTSGAITLTADAEKRVPLSQPVILYPDHMMQVAPFYCLLADLNGMDDDDFLQRLLKSFNIRVARDAADASPVAEREFGLYLSGQWYHMTVITGTWFFADPVKDLDVSILRDNMLAPVLGISNTDEDNSRIRYVEGTRALVELSTLVDQGAFKAVVVQFPPSVKRILDITDLGRTMPEKSFLMITEPDPHLILSALS
jgi:hypothetical protein